MDEALIAKYAEAAKLAAKKIQTKVTAKPANEDVDDDFLQKYSDAALANHQKKKEKNVKYFNKSPEERLTVQLVKDLYKQANILPSRSIFWFYEDRRSHPLIQQSHLDDVDEDVRKVGDPIAALILAKASQMAAQPEWLAEPSNQWTLGSIAQFTGFTSSYIQGFLGGFNGHAPGHRLCSYHFHCGYADGKIAYSFLVKEGSLTEVDSEDPFREEDDIDALNELVRVKGYWRDEWGAKPKFLIDTVDLTEERMKELGLLPSAETGVVVS